MINSNNKLLYIFTFIFGCITALYLKTKGFFDTKIEVNRLGVMSQDEETETKEIYEKMGYDTSTQKKKLEDLKIRDLKRKEKIADEK